jgi:hypothetical protein
MELTKVDQESTFFICDARRGYGRGAPLIRRNIEKNKKFFQKVHKNS